MYPKILLVLLITVTLAGCAPAVSKEYTYNFNATLGQELIDLKSALDQGAIDKEQYDEMFESIKNSRFDEK